MMKQVIVMRTDLNMRKGKMIVQGSHASIGAYEKAQAGPSYDYVIKWKQTGTTKICVRVESLEEMQTIHDLAKAAGIVCYCVLDAGRTEFKEPTYTCLCLGPAPAEEIDKITGNLKLL